MSEKITAPFTPEQVRGLNIFQNTDAFHPFTCGNPDCREVLVAHPEGWRRPKCDYTQNWAHDFMVAEHVHERTEPVWLSVDFCKTICNPLEQPVWLDEVVTREMVKRAGYNPSPHPQKIFSGWGINQHAGRIRWLAENGWEDPIEVDVGIPSVGFNVRLITDGNHRLAAAIYRGDQWILANVQGQVDVFSPHVRKN